MIGLVLAAILSVLPVYEPSDSLLAQWYMHRKTATQAIEYNMDSVHFTTNVPDSVLMARLAGMHTLITMHETIRWQYRFGIRCHGEEEAISFALDTKEMKALLGDVPFTEPEVSAYLREYLQDNTKEVMERAGIEGM